MFTPNSDTVDFNNLNAQQITTINSGADLYNALTGNDTVTLPDAAHATGLNWEYGTKFKSGPGNDRIIVPTNFVGSQAIDGGSNDGNSKDVLELPGSASDYKFSVNLLGSWQQTQTTIQSTPFPSLVFTTNDVEQAKFKDPVKNVVSGLDNWNEVGTQIVEAYSNNPTASAQSRNWHPVAAIELGVFPKRLHKFLIHLFRRYF